MRLIVTAALVAMAAPGALRAESVFNLVFRSGTLDGLSPGTRLTYESGPVEEGATGGRWRGLVVTLGPDEVVAVDGWPAEGDGPARPVGSFSAPPGNPVAMIFLEEIVLRIAERTGGSPYYIRNRIRDALGAQGEAEPVTVDWGGEAVPASEIAIVPFANDARRTELGGFADLEITFVMSEEVPGWYHSLAAEAPGTAAAAGFSSVLTLAEAGE